jgi:hypothetical protein
MPNAFGEVRDDMFEFINAVTKNGTKDGAYVLPQFCSRSNMEAELPL